jgi:hypothetical protein
VSDCEASTAAAIMSDLSDFDDYKERV